jgi:drug/metabolite transporter (DMT)-like permease
MSATAFAVPLALLTTAAFNTGLIVEKRALNKMPALRVRRVGHTMVSLLSTPAWLAGAALMLTGLALTVIILTFEPISLVQPILASGVVLTLVLSRLVLRERLGGGEFWCVVVMAVALVLLALSQTSTSGQSSRAASALPMVVVVVPSLIVGVLVAIWPWRARVRQWHPTAAAICAGVGTGLLYGVGSLSSKGLSAALGHHNGAGTLVINILSSPYLYLLGGCSAVAMLLYQGALQVSRASILIPVSSVVSSGYFLIVGTWLFHEQLPSNPVKLALRLSGIVAAVAVIVILSRQPAEPEPALAEIPPVLVQDQPSRVEGPPWELSPQGWDRSPGGPL